MESAGTGSWSRRPLTTTALHDGPTLQTMAASVSFLPYLAKWHLRLLQQPSNSLRHLIKPQWTIACLSEILKSSYG
ncbi:hypothetical protein E2C01_083191 [Portunus trituberculatus]|uniref:Uncharacterized protein n=1 Tax=Portunus trituberculatus TaxID=210409 RepID=A0A5B7IRT9_PORTR|nr:hypothetical protein [Portunus trituberculatus]